MKKSFKYYLNQMKNKRTVAIILFMTAPYKEYRREDFKKQYQDNKEYINEQKEY